LEIDLDGSLYPHPGSAWHDPRSPAPRSVVELIRDGTLDASLGALLWLLVEGRVPLVVAAGPSGTGKSTLLHALLAFLPRDARTREVAGYAEDFAWLPQAAALGWRPHGFGGVRIGSRGAASPAADVVPATTVLLVHELSDHLPIYTWGEPARIVVRALSLGYGLGATIHAETLEEVLGELGGPDVGLTTDELSRLGVVIVLRALRAPTTGALVRRVTAAHYVRPVVRDAAGHVQRPGPAVLATWDPVGDRFEDFAWGVAAELAERVGRRAGDLEAERERRAAYLDSLVQAGLAGTAEMAAAVEHYRHLAGEDRPAPAPTRPAQGTAGTIAE
jgi:energy-coupling factor transporter ATP-binding protein EcfA2